MTTMTDWLEKLVKNTGAYEKMLHFHSLSDVAKQNVYAIKMNYNHYYRNYYSYSLPTYFSITLEMSFTSFTFFYYHDTIGSYSCRVLRKHLIRLSYVSWVYMEMK